MNSGKENSSAASTDLHFHTVSHYTFFPGQPRWPLGTEILTYSFLPANGLTDEVCSKLQIYFCYLSFSLNLVLVLKNVYFH